MCGPCAVGPPTWLHVTFPIYLSSHLIAEPWLLPITHSLPRLAIYPVQLIDPLASHASDFATLLIFNPKL